MPDVGMPVRAAGAGGGSLLDGDDPAAVRALLHRALDEALDGMEEAARGDGPVWRAMPPAVRAALAPGAPLPAPVSAEAALGELRGRVTPYAVGNRHPRFFGWVHGGGTALGVLSEIVAAALNANCGGRDHAPVALERQVVGWAASLLGMPAGTSGLVTTGTSMANLVAVLCARHRALPGARRGGVAGTGLVAYASEAAHLCVARAMDFAGLGSDAPRLVSTDTDGRVRPDVLRRSVRRDRAAGLRPFLLVGTAGTVDTGAFDDLATLGAFARAEGLWFHVDGAFGAAAALSPRLRHLVAGIGRADSVAFDWHKLAGVNYEAGTVLVHDAAAHRAAFARGGAASYLAGAARGPAAEREGEPWPVDLGPELSRGFRALKVWMALRVHGADRIGAAAERCAALAARLAARVEAERGLKLAAPAAFNVVCFRVRGLDDAGHAALAAAVAERGGPVLSTARVGGRVALRACVCNHRTGERDVDAVLPAVLAAAEERG